MRSLRLSFILLVLTCLLDFVPRSAYGRGLAEIRRSGELRICYPSLSTLTSEAQIDHPHVRTAITFARFLNVAPRLREIPWDKVFEDSDGKVHQDRTYTPALLKHKTCDFFPSDITILPWRQNKLAFAPIYASRKIVIVRREDVPKYVNIASLGGKKTITQSNTTYADWLEHQNKDVLRSQPIRILYNPTSHPLVDLRARRSDFAILDAYSALSAIRSKYQDLAVAFPVGMTEQIAWGFAREDRDLLDRFQDFFRQASQDSRSEVNGHFRRFFGIDLPQVNELTYLVINKN